MTLNELIDLLGGDAAVARICRIGPSAVSNWRLRGVPAARCIQLARAAERKGVAICLKDLPPVSRGRQGAS
jgi:hypothetical protein